MPSEPSTRPWLDLDRLRSADPHLADRVQLAAECVCEDVRDMTAVLLECRRVLPELTLPSDPRLPVDLDAVAEFVAALSVLRAAGRKCERLLADPPLESLDRGQSPRPPAGGGP